MKPMRMTLLLGAAAVVLTGCVNPFTVACLDEAKGTFKYNDQQARVACAEAQYGAFPELFSVDEETEQRTLNPHGLKVADVSEVLEAQRRDIDTFLSYENQGRADSVDALDGLREGLEKAEIVAAARHERLLFVETYNTFTERVGGLPDKYQASAEEIDYYFPGGPEAYSMRLFYYHPDFKLFDIAFTAKYLEAAKAERTLRRVGRIQYTASRDYAEKVTDLRDRNKFDWKGHDRGWVIETYKILAPGESPQDNAIQYVEVFRMRADMSTTETQPAMYGFLPTGGNRVNTFLIDYDIEGTQGYGIPDEVWSSMSVETGEAFIDSSQLRRKLVELYDSPNRLKNRDRPGRQRPAEPPIYTTIVRSGEVEIELWDVNDDGWDVPLDYEDLNFSLKVNEIPFDVTEEDKAFEKFKKIKGFEKRFKKLGGDVVVIEHWRPKDEYAERDIAYVNAYATVKIRRDGQTQEEADVEYFAEGPIAITYKYAGKYWMIVDADENDNLDGVFEKRREISQPEAMKTSSSSRFDGGP